MSDLTSDKAVEDLVDAAALCLATGQHETARALAMRAIQQRPESVEAWTNLSWAETELGNLQQAADAADQALRIDPLNAVAWHNLAHVQARVGNWEQSLAYANRALTIDSDMAQAWAGRGMAMLSLERFTEAVACFDKALQIDPSCAAALGNRPIAAAQVDPRRRNLLRLAMGMAGLIADGEATNAALESGMLPVFRRDPAYDADLVRSFDAIAAASVPNRVTPLMRHFCEVNQILASGIGDPSLIEQCRQRLAAAVAASGSAHA